MFSELHERWCAFKAYAPGHRFQTIHEHQADAPAWVKPVVVAGAVLSFGIGVALSILPGPAIVFFAVAGALAAMESAWIARALDRAELWFRKRVSRYRRRRERRAKSRSRCE
jgi:hypothetical protein